MSFCNKCGFRTRDADRFCQNCGHEISTPVPQTHNRFSDEKKQALSKLNNILFLIFIIVDEFFLLTFSNDWHVRLITMTNEDLAWEFFGKLVIYGFTYFAIKIKCINEFKPNWALGLLVFVVLIGLLDIASLTGVIDSETDYSNYNWADYATRLTSIVETLILFFIWKKAKYE
jgi:hypothetical protein